ncbi:MAG: hypothetical protein NVSMB56_15060 [Pyrinomonadaceae bacterium]
MCVTLNSVIGTVTAVDVNAKQISLKTDMGDTVGVMLDEKTVYMKIPPGEKNLDHAMKITLTNIAVGDRVWARGKVADDKKSIPARAVVVMTKADITRKSEHDRDEWKRRGIVGTITALDPATKEITVQARGGRGMMGGNGAPPVVIEAKANNLAYRRYAPDSVKFEDAKVSSFDELKIGDQIRALGERNADGAHFTPEEIVSGTFRTFAATIDSVNPQTNEIKLKDLQSGQMLTVVVSPDTNLRRIPAEFATMLANRMQPRTEGGAGASPNGAPPQNSTQRPTQGQGTSPRGEGGGLGGGRGGFDPQDLLQRLPTTTVAEFKKGDAVIVSSTVGSDPKRVTAVALLAGVDAFMGMMRGSAGAGALGTGLPPGLDIGIGLP